MSGDDLKSCFFQKVPHFPDLVTSDGQVPIHDFLAASSGIASFVDLLGIVFKPVTSDLRGNINKIQNVVDTSPNEFKVIRDILTKEKENISDGEFRIGSDAICWLNRGLTYLYLFLTFFNEDHNNNIQQGDLSKYFSQAYDMSLKKYHNWFTQKIFSLCLMSVPSREALVKLLVDTGDDSKNQELEKELFGHISKYLVNLKVNIDSVDSLLKELDIVI